MDNAECRRQALDLLARREHSRLEMRRKLESRGYSDGVVAATLDALEANRQLDQGRFTESFVRSRAERGHGPLRIRQELTQRGIASSMIADHLSIEDFDWCALARDVRVRKFGEALPASYKERARQMRFLQYRGFDSDHIKSALDAGPDTD